jgi:hypothetical protein
MYFKAFSKYFLIKALGAAWHKLERLLWISNFFSHLLLEPFV